MGALLASLIGPAIGAFGSIFGSSQAQKNNNWNQASIINVLNSLQNGYGQGFGMAQGAADPLRTSLMNLLGYGENAVPQSQRQYQDMINGMQGQAGNYYNPYSNPVL